MRILMIGAAGLALTLAACGTNERDRVQGGAAAGAATGAGVGALGGPVGAAVGAVVGGGAGAVTGATTSPSEVNLGKPLWRDPEVRTPLDEQNRSRARSSSGQRGTRGGDVNAAFMGGGMVVEEGGTPRNPGTAPASTTSTGTPGATPVNPAPHATP
ncbi:hypothetical protein [Roseomonas sp. KE0001]|uniref:hypothetical protein n=1 Tax=Roseomonas sp. KE0001 TaxID=2479201 RepID=UPI0018E040FD|nr:hypothetical protein [Roseomonas sp. KE0001]